MQESLAEASPLITLGIPSGLCALVLSLIGIVWRGSARVTIAESNLANTTERLKEHKEAAAIALSNAEKACEARDELRKAEVAEVKRTVETLSVRHDTAVAEMSRFRIYVADNLVTLPRLQEAEGRLSDQMKENRDTTGRQIMDLGKQIDRILSERAARSRGGAS